MPRRIGQHAYHHVYKYADQLNAFSGYAFKPQDGWSQGMALPLATLVVLVLQSLLSKSLHQELIEDAACLDAHPARDRHRQG